MGRNYSYSECFACALTNAVIDYSTSESSSQKATHIYAFMLIV